MSAAPVWSTQCLDWEERIVEKRSLIPFEPLFPDQAQAALDIFTSLKAVDVGGAPTLGAISRQWTLDFVAAIFGSYDADAGRRLITEYLELVSKKNGKALALDTPIPTPTGWTTMGEIEPGDWVLGANGHPCRVTATSPVFHDHKCFRMSFSNGEMVTADAGHLWETSGSVKTTREIAGTLAVAHALPMRGRASVHVTAAVEVPSVPVKCIVVDSPDHLFLFGKTMLPTHNSSQAAGIMLTALLMNWRDEAEYLILSPTVEIANNSFGPAAAMVRADPELSALLRVQDNIRTITHRDTNATLKVIAAENDTVGGKKATGILVDELWLFGKRADAENMLREATGGIASRPEGFVIYLTTQSDAPPAGVFKQKLDYARDVRDGKIVDPQMLPILYEFPRWMVEKKLERLPENFYVTNPNLGASVDNAYLVRELGKAIAAGEHSLRGFLAKHLNVEIGMNLRADRWAGAEFWLQAVDPTLCDLHVVLERSDVVCVGIDGGGLDDLLGLAVLGRDEKTGEWLLWVRAWAHPIVLERQQAEAARMLQFAEEGDLVLVERIGQDVEGVIEAIQECEASGKLDKIGVDPVGIGAIVDALEEIGITIEAKRIVAVSQGWKLNGAIKTTERRIAEGAMKHAGRPIMDWCAGNAKVEPRGNAITVTKQASGTAKIDPLMATFNAVSLMSLAPQSKFMPAGYSLLTV